jgi:hypothetical protein
MRKLVFDDEGKALTLVGMYYVGPYYVDYYRTEDAYWQLLDPVNDNVITGYDGGADPEEYEKYIVKSLDEAKACCQRDYEQRVRAIIEESGLLVLDSSEIHKRLTALPQPDKYALELRWVSSMRVGDSFRSLIRPDAVIHAHAALPFQDRCETCCYYKGPERCAWREVWLDYPCFASNGQIYYTEELKGYGQD